MIVFKKQSRRLNLGAVFCIIVSLIFSLTNQLPVPLFKITDDFSVWLGDLLSLVNQLAISCFAAWMFYRLTILKEYEYTQRRQRDYFAYHLGKVEANYEFFRRQSGVDLAKESPIEFAINLVNQQKPNASTMTLVGADVTHCSIHGGYVELIDEWYCLSVKILEKANCSFETLSPVGADMLRERLKFHQSVVNQKPSIQTKVTAIRTFVRDDIPKTIDAVMRQRATPIGLDSAIEDMIVFHISNVEPVVEMDHPRVMFSRK